MDGALQQSGIQSDVPGESVLPSTGLRRYFAAEPIERFLPQLFERIDAFYRHVQDKGWLALWRASHKAAYAGWYTGGRMNATGENGKFQSIEPNEYANLKTHVLNLITGQKAQPEAQARNMDHASQRQTIIANGLAETLAEDHDYERHRQIVNERGLLYGAGWGLSTWDPAKGEPFIPEMGQAGEAMVTTGDLEYRTLHELDVVRDVTKSSSDGHRWYCTRTYANRYDLMAEWPAFAAEIDGVPSAIESLTTWPRLLTNERETYGGAGVETDDVIVWDFFHERCPAVPDGLMVRALSPDLALGASPLPYRKIPLRRWSAGDVEGTIFGYTLFYDLLALQQWINAIATAAATRSTSFAVPDVWFPDGASVTRKIMEGLGVLEGGQVKPEVMDWLQGPGLKMLIDMAAMVRGLMSTYSGINNVARGQPEGGITAASALALLESRAIQFMALSQKADIGFNSATFTDWLHIYQDFPSAPFLVKLMGKSNRQRVEQFQSHEIGAVSGYSVKMGNPLQSTTAGRMQLIEGAKAAGVTFTQQQYWQVMTTGKLDPVTEGPQKEMELVSAENERLSQGQPCHALISDDWRLHISEHKIVLADPDLRERAAADPSSLDAAVVAATLEHIQEHEELGQMMTLTRPALLAASIPPQPPMPLPAPPVPPGGPGAPGGPPNGNPKANVSGPLAEPPAGAPPQHIEQAQPARNPVTGQRAALALPS